MKQEKRSLHGYEIFVINFGMVTPRHGGSQGGVAQRSSPSFRAEALPRPGSKQEAATDSAGAVLPVLLKSFYNQDDCQHH